MRMGRSLTVGEMRVPNLTVWYFYKQNEGVGDDSGDQTGRTNETRDRNLG